MLEKMVTFLAGPALPFRPSSLEHKQASMFIFAVFITFITFGSYIVENMMLGFYPLAGIETAMLLVALGAYLDFRQRHNVRRAMLLLIFTVSTVTISALYFEGIEHYDVLFWTAALPLFVFLLLGHRKGLHWSFANVAGILLVIAAGILPGTHPLFSTELLLQVLFGYLVVSAIAYYFESQRSSLETRLFEALRERETLLREVHHRVKNNMQVMMGLLWLQSEKIEDPASSKVLLTNVDRLSAMAALHERLYRQENVQRIDMQEYLEAIVSHLQTLTRHAIVLECEPMHLNMHDALQIGLIANEAVTNALQHAFDTPDHGRVRLALRRVAGRCMLTIADNGKGMESAEAEGSLGNLLIRDFAHALPEADLRVQTRPSVSLNLTFACGSNDAA